MTTGSRSVVRSSVLRYLVLSAVVLVVIGVATAVLASRLAIEEEVAVAQRETRSMADRLAAPLVDAAVRRGDPRALESLGHVLEDRMRDGSVTHIVVYTADGLVLWADDERLLRRDVELEPDVAALSGTRGTIVDKPGEREMHPWSRPGDDQLVEVYVGARDADGVPFVFEAYMSPEHIEEDRQAILVQLLPVVLVIIALFLLATLPLAVQLARRVDRAAATRSDLLVRSVAALREERQRLAQILHDGVVQDLSAAGVALSALADPPPGAEPRDPGVQQAAARIERLVQEDLHELRVLVSGLFPADAGVDDLPAALEALRSRTTERFGLEVDLDESGVAGLDRRTSGLVFRVVREALANVGNHAQADAVAVSVRRTVGQTDPDDGVVVTVTDDGIGPGDATVADQSEPDPARDHLGLRLLSRQLEELGGSLELSEAEGGGTVLTAWVPAAPVG